MNDFLKLLSDVWDAGLFGISLGPVISSIFTIILAFLLRGFVINVVIGFLTKLSKKSETTLDDKILESLKKPLGYIPITLALYICTLILPLQGIVLEIATNIVKAFIVFTIFSALANSIKPIFQVLATSSWLTPSMQMWLERASKTLVWIIGIAVILDIFGIQIGPLVAGLGLFSVAVALGAQDFFKNLIAGILVIGENRFQPGDRIEVPGQLHGIVENIGFRSTVVRTFDTAPMIIPNAQLSDVKIINHGEMKNRRINWRINLLYSTSKNQLEKISQEIKDYLVKSDDFIVNDELQPVVKVVELGASSIDVMIVAFCEPVGFADFNQIKQDLIFNIMEIVESNNTEFAYPSTSLYVESLPEK
jgi:MscS family membrane protein